MKCYLMQVLLWAGSGLTVSMDDVIAHLKGFQSVQSTPQTTQRSQMHVILTTLEEVLTLSREKARSEVFKFEPQQHI